MQDNLSKFTYIALDSKGVKHTGETVSRDKLHVAETLSTKGLQAISISAEKIGIWEKLNQPLTGRQYLNSDQLLIFTRNFNQLLNAGLNVDSSLKILHDMQLSPSISFVVSSLKDEVKKGQKLYQTLNKLPESFPPFYRVMVEAGEKSGSLAKIMTQLNTYLDHTNQVKRDLGAALIYPAILTVLMFVTIGVVIGFILPQFESIFDGVERELPLLTRAIFAIGGTLSEYLFLILAFFLFFGVLIINGKTSKLRKSFDSLALSIPFIKRLVRDINLTKFFRTLGALVEGGKGLDEAYDLSLRSINNSALYGDLSEGTQKLRQGEKLSTVLKSSNYIPKYLFSFIIVGEETARIGKEADNIANILDVKLSDNLKKFIAYFTPIITLILGGFVALIVIAIFMGLMTVNEFIF